MRRILFLLLFLVPQFLWSQTEREEQEAVKVYFRVGTSVVDEDYKSNGASLMKFANEINSFVGDSTARLGRISITSSTSPEGGHKINSLLAQQRAKAITDWLMDHTSATLTYTVEQTSCDWEMLIDLVESNPKVPYQSEVLDVLRSTSDSRLRLNRLYALRSSEPYFWLLSHVFPEMRYAAASTTVHWEPLPVPEVKPEPVDTVVPEPAPAPVVEEPAPLPVRKPFYFALKTNLLYDIAIIHNIGAEFYLGNNWSLAGNWQYIWLRNRADHKYWRVGAGDVSLRKWFGRKALDKPLTGHHAGIYGQMVTYDFAPTGKRGTMAEDYNWSLGFEYGYSHPIARRLNLDFTLGIGYHWGEYKEYEPIDEHSVWQTTKQRSYFGPTKLEVSLVWLLGRGNYNKEKGGQK